MISLLVSASPEETRRLSECGPRRDFLEIARLCGGRVSYRPGAGGGRSGLRAKIWGPHMKQAWAAARAARAGDVIFADGEHVGLPLVLFLALRRRRVRVVMLGHFVTRPWKRAAFWLASRVFREAHVVVHSVVQRDAVRGTVGRRWPVEVMAYQVDTAFWTPGPAACSDRPFVLAVGSENRDYETLARAARGLEADVLVAAGSHWARQLATTRRSPANVKVLTSVLGFSELRRLYLRASVVVVPLHDVPNQSGVTSILEAMSMGRPVVVTATEGQRECVSGPLVTADGRVDWPATADRGPHLLSKAAQGSERRPWGFYVPVGDSQALRHALERLLADPATGMEMGRAGREAAEAHFTVERYATALAGLLQASHGE